MTHKHAILLYIFDKLCVELKKIIIIRKYTIGMNISYPDLDASKNSLVMIFNIFIRNIFYNSQ